MLAVEVRAEVEVAAVAVRRSSPTLFMTLTRPRVGTVAGAVGLPSLARLQARAVPLLAAMSVASKALVMSLMMRCGSGGKGQPA